MKKPRKRIVLLATVVTLLILRGLLPLFIENRINQSIEASPKVTGGVEGVDLWLLSGRIGLDGLTLYKANANIPAPILSVESTAFSISWLALFRGHLFGDIVVTAPTLNIVDGKQEADSQTGAEVDWRRAFTSFYPFEINKVSVSNGALHFRNFKSEPPVDLYLHEVELSATNITNELLVEQSRAAKIEVSAKTIGNGELRASSEFNLVAEPAKADIQAKLLGVEMVDLNSFARAYANIDIQDGAIDVVTKMNLVENEKIADINGSIDPLITNLNVLQWRQDVEIQQDSGFTILWEGLIDGLKWMLEVGAQDKLETSIPVEGTLSDPDIGTASAIFQLIGNAVRGFFAADDESKEQQSDN